jgi:hypothetical protein
VPEIWKSVNEYEDRYEVSNLGKVRSLYRQKPILKPFVSKWGYEIVSLCKNGKVNKCSVHRIVASAFVPKQEGRDVVNHIDGNKQNNRAENLEWCTPKENSRHALDNGLLAPCIAAARVTAQNILSNYGRENRQPILAIDQNTSKQTEFSSISEAAEILGFDAGNISRVLSGKYKQLKGYTFKKII